MNSAPVLTAAMGLGSFAWSFVYIALPFYIERISTASPSATVSWTGWIIGITSLVAVASGPVGAHYAGRGDLKRAFVLVQLGQGVGFAITALADSLVELFLVRLGLGIVGSASTFAFLMASRTGGGPRDGELVLRRLSAVQSSLLIAQVVGPLVGTVLVVRLGFRLSYLVGGLMLVAAAALVQWGEPDPPPARQGPAGGRRYPMRAIVLTCGVVLASSCQETFLAAVLPQALSGLGVAAGRAIEAGGLLLFVSGVAAALGGLVAPRLAQLWPERRLLPALIALSSALLVAMVLARSLWLFLLLRTVQGLVVAPVFPLVVARIARFGGSDTIGIINAARVGSGFIGPVVATTILAWGPLNLVYLTLGAVGLLAAYFLRR